MKAPKVSETIKLHQALSCIDEQLDTYADEPWRLAADMQDLATMKNLAESGYFKKIKVLRKKNLDSEKALKGFEGNLLEMISPTVVRSNAQFAYAIHSLTTKKHINRPPRSRVITELKLKYMESKGIVQTDWEEWYIPEEGVLGIKDKQGNYEVKISVDMTPGNPDLAWKIMNVLMKGQHHQLLFNFFNDFLAELSKNKQKASDWEPLFIMSIRKILTHLPCVMVFLNAKEKLGKLNSDQSFSHKFISGDGSGVSYSWHLDIFDRLDEPNIRLKINDEQVLCIKCKSKVFTAKMILGEAGQKVDLKMMEQMYLDDSDMLLGLPQKIYSLHYTLKRSFEIYQHLKQAEIKIFAIVLNVKWVPEHFNPQELESVTIVDEGIYIFACIDKGVLIRLEEDLSLSCWDLERGLMGCLLKKKNIKLVDMIEHMLLRKRINELNKDLQFKTYQMYLRESDTTMQFVYEFKSYRFAESNRIFKLTKAEEDLLSLSSDSNDNFVLIVKVTANFEKIYFSAYKMVDGPAKQSEITDQFLSQAWREYRQTVTQSTPSRYNYKQIAECVFYICKYYMVERTFHKRMTEDQKKWTVYRFT